MTQDEITRFNKMEKTVESIQNDVSEIKLALLGNPLSGDNGLAGRLNVLTAKQEILESRITTLQEEKVKNSVYIKIIGFLAATTVTASIAWIFSFFK